MRFVFIQNLKSTKEAKVSVMEFTGEEAAKEQVQIFLDSSLDVLSVDVFEFLGSAKKVVTTEWS